MTGTGRTLQDELERIQNVSDMLCTGHAGLRDRYARWATLLDLSIFGSSTWLVALTFVDPVLNVTLTPFGWDPRFWVGVLSILTFFLSIVQLRVDWKGRSEAHGRTLEIYAEVKREAGFLLASGQMLDEQACRRVLARYDMASAVGIAIPESEFLPQKRRHRTKVAISRYLDTHPTAWLWLTSLKFMIRDNFGRGAGSRQ